MYLIHFVTFRIRRNQTKCILAMVVCMYVCVSVNVSVCPSLSTLLHYCTDPDVTLGNGTECPVVVHYWVDLRLMPRFHCCGSIHIRIQCYRSMLLCKCISVALMLFEQLLVEFTKPDSNHNPNPILTTPSHV